MIVLALELSSPRRSVALSRQSGDGNSGELLGQRCEEGGRSARPLTLVDAVLSGAGLKRAAVQRLVVGLGPGSYTGIRSAIALAQGWQLAQDVSVTGVSTVECLAVQAQAQGWFGRVTVAIDAQRNEYYVASYTIGPVDRELREPLRLVGRADVPALAEAAGALLIGPEVDRLAPEGRVLFPQAQFLVRCAPLQSAQPGGKSLNPIYLREVSFVKAPPPRVLPD